VLKGARSVITADESHLAIFLRETYHAIGPQPSLRLARYDHLVDGRLVGTLSGVVDGDTFCSGFSAPFGGVEILRAGEPVEHVMELVERAREQLVAQGVCTIRVRCRPPFYTGETSVQFALSTLGFSVTETDLNYHLDLAPITSAEAYVEALKSPARRALRHALGLGLEFDEAADEDEWAAAYEVLRHNRVSKGRPMRLSLEYVTALRDLFPGRVRMYVLRTGGAVCAAALVYRILPGRDLVQYWGDAHHALERSPMNVLVLRLVERALAEGVETIDLGISTDHGVPNQGLIQFKQSVLARPSLRPELEWTA
jgi:predicted N-acyltransferase